MGLTSHLYDAYDAFSSFYFSLFYMPSLTMMANLTNQIQIGWGSTTASDLFSHLYWLTWYDFSQYIETCEVLLDYPKMGGGGMLRIMQNRPLENFCMPIVMYTAEDWLLSSQKMELNVLKNFSHIVQTWLLQIKVGMIELSSRLHIKEGISHQLY